MKVLAARCYDHRPLLWCMNQAFGREGRRKRMFRYEASWGLEKECIEVLKRIWDRGVIREWGFCDAIQLRKL